MQSRDRDGRRTLDTWREHAGHGSSGTYSAKCNPVPAACLHELTCACIQQAEDMPSSDGYSCNVVSDAGLIFTKFNE